MRFRNSLHLLIDNFGIVYKMLLYKIVIGIITLSIALAFVIPNLSYIFDSAEFASLLDVIQRFGQAMLSADSEYLVGFQSTILEAASALGFLAISKISNIVSTIIAIIFTYILSRFLDTVGNYSFGSMLNDKMSSYAEISFFASFIKSLDFGSLYAICYVLMSFVYDFLLIAVCYLFFFTLLSFVPFILTLFLSSAVIFMAEALKMTLVSGWMPAMVEGGKSMRAALKYSLHIKLHQFGKIYSNYLITLYILVVINVICAISTLFSSLLISLPASFLMLLCIQYVNYYTLEGKKYFVNYYKIADNKDKGEKSKFIDEKDIKEERY